MSDAKREAMLECMNAMEDALIFLGERRDIWQNNIVFWLCRSVWLLLENAVKESRRSTGEGANANTAGER
jgi:hypothetical protein